MKTTVVKVTMDHLSTKANFSFSIPILLDPPATFDVGDLLFSFIYFICFPKPYISSYPTPTHDLLETPVSPLLVPSPLLYLLMLGAQAQTLNSSLSTHIALLSF